MTTLPATTTDDGPDLGRLERQLRSMDGVIPPLRDARQVREIAQRLVAPGKGILAADESDGTADKRLAAVGAATGPAGRRAYRQVLLGTADLGAHISGVILYDETIRQTADDGTPFPSFLSAAGVLPGIKVDTGIVPLARQPGETVTKGLDGLRTRLANYTALGARFAKWRATSSRRVGGMSTRRFRFEPATALSAATDPKTRTSLASYRSAIASTSAARSCTSPSVGTTTRPGVGATGGAATSVRSNTSSPSPGSHPRRRQSRASRQQLAGRRGRGGGVWRSGAGAGPGTARGAGRSRPPRLRGGCGSRGWP